MRLILSNIIEFNESLLIISGILLNISFTTSPEFFLINGKSKSFFDLQKILFNKIFIDSFVLSVFFVSFFFLSFSFFKLFASIFFI